MAIVDRRSLPLAVHVACASPHEVRLVDATLEDRFIAPYPRRLIADRAYDSDRLGRSTVDEPWDRAYRPASGRPRAPDSGRPGAPTLQAALGVERFFAWLHNSRRLVTRWERHVENFVAMLQLGGMRILLNR
jgi:transposase